MLGVFPDTAIIESLLKAIENQNKADYGFQIFTTSQNWTVPANLRKPIHILAIGGGGGGGGGYSSTYVGGGGGSGAVQYAKLIVTPGTELTISVGAGGSAGRGGASPTAGGGGGYTFVYLSSATLSYNVGAAPGSGGGAASSSANGTAGAGGPTGWGVLATAQGSTPMFVLNGYMIAGQSGSGQTPGLAPVENPTFNGSSGMTYGNAQDGQAQLSYGAGGFGGGVNANGNPGIQGAVVIWWGD